MKLRELPFTFETWAGQVTHVVLVEAGETLTLGRDIMPPEMLSIRRGGKVISNGFQMFIDKLDPFRPPSITP